MSRPVLLAGLLAATALTLAGPAAAAGPSCEGGVTAPAKGALHLVEGPTAGTPAAAVVHAAECTLP